MTLYLALLPALFYLSNGETRFILDDYTAVGSASLTAYPIDICVNYEAAITGPYFGMYTCNDNDDEVSFQSYGMDPTCSTASGSASVVSDSSAADAMKGSFNCVGKDNYGVTDGCYTTAAETQPAAGDDGDDVCCMDGCISVTAANEVCYYDADNTIYLKKECDEDSSTTRAFADAACSTSINQATVFEVNYCAYLERQVLDIYLRVSLCVEDGVDITNDTYCPEEPTTTTIIMDTTEEAEGTEAEGTEAEATDSVEDKAAIKAGCVMIGVMSVVWYMIQ